MRAWSQSSTTFPTLSHSHYPWWAVWTSVHIDAVLSKSRWSRKELASSCFQSMFTKSENQLLDQNAFYSWVHLSSVEKDYTWAEKWSNHGDNKALSNCYKVSVQHPLLQKAERGDSLYVTGNQSRRDQPTDRWMDTLSGMSDPRELVRRNGSDTYLGILNLLHVLSTTIQHKLQKASCAVPMTMLKLSVPSQQTSIVNKERTLLSDESMH